MSSEETKLQQSLTRFDATMIVMGTIIGIGIFFNPQKTVRETGSAGWSLVAWALGSVLALTGAFTYAALGRLVPKTGGPYVYLREAFGRLSAFLYGWMILVAIGSGATAVVGLLFVDYLARFLHWDVSENVRIVVAQLTIFVLMVINVTGVRSGSRVQNVFTVMKILSLTALIVAGVMRGNVPITFAVEPTHVPPSTIAGLAAAMSGVLFTFGGWQNLSNVAGEMKSAEKDLVPAIVQGVIGVAILYLLANYAFVHVLTVPELLAAKTPAADVLEHALGSRAGDIAALLILLSAFGIVNGLLLSLPRIYFAMAEDGMMPKGFASISPRFRTPVVAIAVQAFVAIAFCMMRSVGALTDYVAFADWMFFSLNALALFALVKKMDRRDVGLGYPIVPAIFAALAITVTIGMLLTQWDEAKFGLLFVAAGCLIYAAFLRRRN